MNRIKSFETHFFRFQERTKNVLRDTNEANIDSLMGTKKMSAVFRNSCFSQSGVIVDAKVSDRQRRCCAPSRNIIGYKSSFTCHVLRFVVFAFCLVVCNTRWDLSIYVSSVYPQSGFRLHSSFAEIFSRTEVVFIVVLYTVMVQKSLFRNCPVRWPFKYDATHAHFEQIQTGHLFVVVVVYNIFLTFKRHNFTASLLNLHLIDIRRQIQTRYLFFRKNFIVCCYFRPLWLKHEYSGIFIRN